LEKYHPTHFIFSLFTRYFRLRQDGAICTNEYDEELKKTRLYKKEDFIFYFRQKTCTRKGRRKNG